jgi:hypothetical protein
MQVLQVFECRFFRGSRKPAKPANAGFLKTRNSLPSYENPGKCRFCRFSKNLHKKPAKPAQGSRSYLYCKF